MGSPEDLRRVIAPPTVRIDPPVRPATSGCVIAPPLRLGALLILPLLLAGPAVAAPSEGATETVEQALCRLIDDSAKARGLPVPFLTRLIWRESSFRVGVVSSAGAQGVAQFMPGTARERGLLDPFDPEQAIPHAAHLLADLKSQFGNLGLAAAAYNGGAARVSKWLSGEGGLPAETRAYVAAITGAPAEDWRGGAAITYPEGGAPEAKEKQEAKPAAPVTCMQVTASLRIPSRGDRFAIGPNEGPAAPWGIQLAGNFSKSLALQSFNRARNAYAGVIGEARPMIIGTRLRNRGTRAFYRIRLPAQSRQAADDLCGRIRKVGGACIVLRT
ncbi:Sporulation related domain-containing protein [Methylobacterium pseudosasicola]|uniref:Sporulation related domain-containing protein n=1 Tax=Methylobacterium pseudosasicola TaxID=582667 RepID=A0A1I4V0F7_9HYPH|nr:Sporulation related domain-containing protein [Methylobacterium pseudosasicola]